MAIRSTNTQGNQLHDEATGQFTSDGASSAKKADTAKKKSKGTGKGKGKKFVKRQIPLVKEGASLADLFAKLSDINAGVSVGPLSTAQDIEDNVEKFFSKQVISHLNRLVGRDPSCSPWQFHPKNNKWVSLNIFTCVFGKYRYPDNHAHFIGFEDYDKMSKDPRYTKIFRGITSTGEKRQNILKSYVVADINNLDIYGNGVYGTNIYTTIRLNYAQSYGTPIVGLLDSNARSIDSYALTRIKNSIDANNLSTRVEQHLKKEGLDDDRAQTIAHYFGAAVQRDISLVGILLGYDYQISDGHQRNILNLNKWYIRREQ